MMEQPANLKSEFLNTLFERGYVYQVTDADGLDKATMADKPMIGYIGFDCTAPSLHVGSLLQIMLLRRLQQAGGKPIVVMGGGTTKIGDPSDKDKARPVLTPEIIEDNKNSIKQVFANYLSFGEGPTDAIMVDNAEWLDDFKYIDFLRDYGRHFTINRMLQFESVKRRLEREQPLTFLEFNYMLLQAYDFLELNRRYGCSLQMGGSDQWGNIVNGMELCRRVDGQEAFGLTSPLLSTASGAKMGKTADGAVWLNADMRSPYEFWQYWRNTEDADVGRFLKLFTDLPMDEIARLEALEGAEINDAKIALADAVTSLLHGEAATKEAKAATEAAFSGGGDASALPSVSYASDDLSEGLLLVKAYVDAGLASSLSEARRHVKGGAARLKGEAVSDMGLTLNEADFAGGDIQISIGKKRHALLKLG